MINKEYRSKALTFCFVGILVGVGGSLFLQNVFLNSPVDKENTICEEEIILNDTLVSPEMSYQPNMVGVISSMTEKDKGYELTFSVAISPSDGSGYSEYAVYIPNDVVFYTPTGEINTEMSAERFFNYVTQTDAFPVGTLFGVEVDEQAVVKAIGQLVF